MQNLYQILGVEINATEDEIKQAYRKLSKKFHPDKNEGDKYFEEWSKRINEAYSVLGNKSSRLEYDREALNSKSDNNKSTREKAYKEGNYETEMYILTKIRENTNNYIGARKKLNAAKEYYKLVSSQETPGSLFFVKFFLSVFFIALSSYKIINIHNNKENNIKIKPETNRDSVSVIKVPNNITNDNSLFFLENAEDIDEYYLVFSDKCYFYNNPDEKFITKKYLVLNDSIHAIKRYNDYVYTEYISKYKKNRLIKGWIKNEDLISSDMTDVRSGGLIIEEDTTHINQ